LAGNLPGAGRRFAAQKAPADAGHQAQSDKLAAALIDILNLLFFQVAREVLNRIGNLRSKKKDQPRKIEADHKEGNQTEACRRCCCSIPRATHKAR